MVFDPRDPFHADLLEVTYVAAERSGYDVVLGARVPTRPEQRAVGLAVEAVVERLDRDAQIPPRDILLDPRLVIRGTTGPATR